VNVRTLEIRLFGSLQVSLQGESLPKLRHRSVEWLLALLALRAAEPVSRSWLAGTLWPESSEEQALLNLRVGLMRLRDALGEEATRIVASDRRTLHLDLTDAFSDVAAFDAAMRAGDEVSLRGAVELYTGPLLSDCDSEWAAVERNARAEQYVAALETLAEGAQARGEPKEAIRHLRVAEALDPLRDSLVQRLMACLAAAGDPASAIEVYRNFRIRLHEELSAAPDAATTRLFHEIRDAAQAAVRHARAATGADATVARPPRPVRAPSVPVPRPVTSLIGREKELAEVRQLLVQNRLVTLLGGGGVGKTRLALEVAARAEEALPGGVVWVELASLASGDLILPSVADAIGLGDERAADSEELEQSIVARLSAERSLLVLDNCEHLRDAAAQKAHALLLRCPELRVLATSRQRLGIPGEVAWYTPSLRFPDPDSFAMDAHDTESLLHTYPSLRLLAERMAQVRPGFQLRVREEILAAARICHILDGIPLALELAGARAQALSLPQIAARLDDRFRLLTGGSRAALPRHQTLRASIDWSYELLSEPERRLLLRLSVFAGGWTLDMAEASSEASGADRGEVVDAMTSLVEKSLALAEEQTAGMRYRMLETVREYTLEKLRESGQERLTREWHADCYLALAEQSRPFLEKPEPVWLDRLEAEHDNLRTALTTFAAQEETIDKAVQMAASLERFWNLRGHFYERRTWLVSLALRPTLPTDARARMLDGAAHVVAKDGDFASAKRMTTERLEIARQLGDRQRIAGALNALAYLTADLGEDPGTARSLAEESLEIMRQLGDRQGMAHVLFHLGHLARKIGDNDQARTRWMECQALDEDLGVKGGHVLKDLGDLALESGDHSAAHRFFGRFVSQGYEIGDRWGVWRGLRGLGMLARAEGQSERAARLFAASFALRQSFAIPPVSPGDRASYNVLQSALRETLGQAALDTVWSEGGAMTTEQIVAYALTSR